MRLLYVPLRAEALERLCRLAERERRQPREQAAYLLELALEGQLEHTRPRRAERARQADRTSIEAKA